MKSGFRSALALWAVLAAGCAQVVLNKDERTFLSGRYGELEAKADSIDLNSANSARTAPICQIYERLKRYDKLGRCLDQLEKKVAAGDTDGMDWESHRVTQGLTAALVAPMLQATQGQKVGVDVAPQLWLMRSEMAMDLGEYRKAVEYSDKMIASLPPLITEARRMFGQVVAPAGRESTTDGRSHRIHALGASSLALALAGEREASLRRVQELAALDTMNFMLTPDKQIGLARTYLALGDYAHAYDVVKQGGDSFGRSALEAITGGSMMEGGSIIAYVEIQRNFIRHKTEMETGRTADAKAGYDALLKNPATPSNGDIYWIVLYDRGRIAEREGAGREAVVFYMKAIEVIERQRASINTEASKIGFVGDKQALYQDLVRMLVAQERVPEAFEFVERAKARALVDMLASKKDFAISSGNVDQVKALLAIGDSAEADARSVTGTDSPQTRSLVVKARADLASQAPELASLVSVQRIPVAEVQQRLPEGETLVEYYDAGSTLYAFVVTRSGLAVRSLNGKDLPATVQEFRRAVQEPSDATGYSSAARGLYDRLLRPLESQLSARITIVPHGALHYLPFNALHDGTSFVIERRSVRELPAAAVLSFLKAGGADKTGGLLAFGNPDLGDKRYDLAFAQAEAEAVVTGMPRSRALVRRQATETSFRNFATGFRYVHVASHGEFDPQVPLESALLLAGDEKNDGRLTVGELYSMRIDAELVTLSACETGLGKIASGDDVVGLARGFLYAGANAIVASLWQVDDRATGELMTEFYAALRAGEDKREALRRAQLSVMKSRPHPFFWAAFQITGG